MAESTGSSSCDANDNLREAIDVWSHSEDVVRVGKKGLQKAEEALRMAQKSVVTSQQFLTIAEEGAERSKERVLRRLRRSTSQDRPLLLEEFPIIGPLVERVIKERAIELEALKTRHVNVEPMESAMLSHPEVGPDLSSPKITSHSQTSSSDKTCLTPLVKTLNDGSGPSGL